jgi:hypothetical protein
VAFKPSKYFSGFLNVSYLLHFWADLDDLGLVRNARVATGITRAVHYGPKHQLPLQENR